MWLWVCGCVGDLFSHAHAHGMARSWKAWHTHACSLCVSALAYVACYMPHVASSVPFTMLPRLSIAIQLNSTFSSTTNWQTSLLLLSRCVAIVIADHCAHALLLFYISFVCFFHTAGGLFMAGPSPRFKYSGGDSISPPFILDSAGPSADSLVAHSGDRVGVLAVN